MLRNEQDNRLDQPSERFCRYEATQRNSIVQHILVPLGLTLDNFTLCLHSVFCVDLRTNSDYFPIQH